METATRIKFTTLPHSLAFQDAQETKSGSTENANAFQDTTWQMEYASLATVMKYLMQGNKDAFLTVEATLITFHHQEHVNVRKDFTEFWVFVEFAETVKPTAQVLNVVWGMLLCARRMKFTIHRSELVNVLPLTIESTEFASNAHTANTTINI